MASDIESENECTSHRELALHQLNDWPLETQSDYADAEIEFFYSLNACQSVRTIMMGWRLLSQSTIDEVQKNVEQYYLCNSKSKR